MPSILTDADKEVVKRTVPKASNKIQAVAVARLYVSLPNRGQKWTYTGLQGAAVLSNDLVGNTFWIKLVDISPAGRGVIWDQEIYDSFQYNQDRTFFHSFELEECLAALSFVDEKEAKQFKKKMDEREKNASKATKAQPFASTVGGGLTHASSGSQKHHSKLGGLFHKHRNTSNPISPQPSQTYLPPQPIYNVPSSRPTSTAGINLRDPRWKPMLDELVQMGISEDQIDANRDFIIGYIQKKQAEELASGIAAELPSRSDSMRSAPPPPPSSAPSGRAPPPAPPGPPSSRGPPRPSSPDGDSPPQTPSPAADKPRFTFRAPPPLADAGKFAQKPNSIPDRLSATRPRSSSNLANPGPPPPPRPSKVALDDDDDGEAPVHRVPPPLDRPVPGPPPPPARGSAPPPTPSRGPVPPPPPSRDTGASAGPPLPPKAAAAPTPVSAVPPPPPPARGSGRRGGAPAPAAVPPPPPPPPPPSSGFGGPPPPPPPPGGSGGGPPAPPPPPSSGPPAAMPPMAADRGDLLAAIRGTGGGGLRKVKATEKKDRSAAAVPGAPAELPGSSPAPAGGAAAGDGGGLANALAAALSQRKKKVSGSDDEREDDEDW